MKGFFNQVGGYFNNNKSGGQGVSTHNIPQQHNIRGRTIQEEKILSEGGFGYIWRAYDVNTREVFALKRMICQGPDRVQIAKREMRNFEMLPNHPNITKYYGGSITPTNDGCIALFLMELCDGGSLFDLMAQTMPSKIPERKLIHLIYESAKGIRALHQANPPITHRDIKIENILQSGGVYKLCDFGSCSTQTIDFRNVQKSQYEQYEDLFNQSTTLMYRPPEMCDPSKKMTVDTKVDIWMLGCVLYTMAFYTHPFVDSSKGGIVDASYRFPGDSKYSKKLHDFIRHMITPDPSYRPTIHDVIQICENYDSMPSIQLNPIAQSLKDKEDAREREEKRFEQNGRGMKKFDGDIPIEELMKLQQKIKATNLNDDEDEENSCTFIKKDKPVVKKQNQKTEKQLEQIRQQFNKPSQNQNQTGQRQNATVSSNNQSTINNEFWNFSAPQNNQPQQQQNKSNKLNQVQDPFNSFGFGGSNENTSQQANSAFDSFNFVQNSNNNNDSNNNNNNSVFDQFGFQNNNNSNQNNFNSNNNQGNFNSNSQNRSNYNSANNFNSNNNNNNNNNQNNAWEFYENSNDNSQNKLNSNNSLQPQYNNQNQQYNSNQGYNQQSNNYSNDPFQQFGSQNQNQYNQPSQFSNQQQQYQQQQQQKPQQQTVNLLDLDDDNNANNNNNNKGAVNLLDLGLEL